MFRKFSGRSLLLYLVPPLCKPIEMMEEGNNKKLNYLFPSFLPVCPFSNIHLHADVSLMKLSVM